MHNKSNDRKIIPTKNQTHAIYRKPNQTKPTQSIAKKSNPRTGSRPSLPSSTHCKTHGNPSKTNLIHPRQNCATHTVKPKDDFENPQSLQLMAEANKLCFAVKPSIKKIKNFEAKEEISFPSGRVRKFKNWYQMMDLVGAL